MEKFDPTYNGGLAGEDDGICKDGQINFFEERKKEVSAFMADWKPLMDFLHETEKKKKCTYDLWFWWLNDGTCKDG